jgi:hypothetical protein
MLGEFAVGGSMVGGRTAQRLRGGVMLQYCSEGAPHTSNQCSRMSSCGTLVGSRWGEGWGVASERMQHLHTQDTVLQVPGGAEAKCEFFGAEGEYLDSADTLALED